VHRAFERVEDVLLARHRDRERLVVFVSADLTASHLPTFRCGEPLASEQADERPDGQMVVFDRLPDVVAHERGTRTGSGSSAPVSANEQRAS
jgi:hypothetical protein